MNDLASTGEPGFDPEEDGQPPKPTDPFPALTRLFDALTDAATLARSSIRKWLRDHEEGIALFLIAGQLFAEVLPRADALFQQWARGPWGHVIANVDGADALGLLLKLADNDDSIEELLEAVLAHPDLANELAERVETTFLNEPLRRQIGHGLALLGQRDYELAVPALIQGLEGAFWLVAEDRLLIRRDGSKMREVNPDGTLGRAVGGVEAIIDLLGFPAAYKAFLIKLVFGGRGHQFRHGTATSGWRLEALLLVIALTTLLETFTPTSEANYLQRAFGSSGASLDAASTTFPALQLLGDLKPDAVKPTVDALVTLASIRREQVATHAALIPPESSS